MTTKVSIPKTFRRTLYSPQYQYYQGVEHIIKSDIQKLILEHDDTVWTPSENTKIEVMDGIAYGRTEIFRQRTTSDD